MTGPAGRALAEWAARHWLALTLSGALLASLVVGFAQYDAARTIDRLRIDALANQRASALQDRLNDRAMMIRAVSAAFVPPRDLKPGALAQVDPALLSHAADIFSFVYIPVIAPSERAEFESLLAQRPGTHGRLFTAGFAPLTAAERDQPLAPVFDIMPATPVNLRSVGLNLAGLPMPGDAVRRAMARRDLAVTAPLQLVQLPGEPAVVAYMPLSRQGTRDALLGMSFRTTDLLEALAREQDSSLGWRVRDVDAPDLVLARGGSVMNGAPTTSRIVSFGDRRWRIDFYRAAMGSGRWLDILLPALLAAAIVGWLLGSTLKLVGQNRALAEALAGRADAEARLRVLAAELTHRIRNILTVVQVIARQSFRTITDIGPALDAYSGRLRALAVGIDLLSDRESGDLAELVTRLDLPLGDRVDISGPRVMLGGAAMQSMTLLVHELWTNAVKHGALAHPAGRVALSWTATDDRLLWDWRERGGPPAQPPTRQGFGQQLLMTIVPRQVGGEAASNFGPEGFSYTLDVPLERLAR